MHLKWSDVNLLRAILMFLETQSWLQRNDPSNDDPDGDDGLANIRAALDHIITAFRAPLESKGVTLETIQDELEEAVGYARRYLRIGTESYRKIWYKLHTCPDSRKWSNVLLEVRPHYNPDSI